MGRNGLRFRPNFPGALTPLLGSLLASRLRLLVMRDPIMLAMVGVRAVRRTCVHLAVVVGCGRFCNST